MKYTKPVAELEKFEIVDVITTSDPKGETTTKFSGNDGDLEPEF